MGDPGGAGSDQSNADLVIQASRRAVSRIAPAELAVFDEIATGWRGDLASARGRGRNPAGSVGFGLDASLVSDVVIQAVAAALGEVPVRSGQSPRRGWLRWRRRTAPAQGGAGDVVLSTAEAHRLRAASRRHAIVLGVPDDLADLLADAVVGSFAVAPESH